ncbi:hypothetical protein Sjap_008308 [Stephania japonica]|uniref:Uncharacterized protein n=1 Tax=Stephania japonica TaxID=461633 RepID=A0AAP0JPP0_9MAGN
MLLIRFCVTGIPCMFASTNCVFFRGAQCLFFSRFRFLNRLLYVRYFFFCCIDFYVYHFIVNSIEFLIDCHCLDIELLFQFENHRDQSVSCELGLDKFSCSKYVVH